MIRRGYRSRKSVAQLPSTDFVTPAPTGVVKAEAKVAASEAGKRRSADEHPLPGPPPESFCAPSSIRVEVHRGRALMFESEDAAEVQYLAPKVRIALMSNSKRLGRVKVLPPSSSRPDSYASNVLGSRGPRKMRACVPLVSRSGKITVFQPVDKEDETLDDACTEVWDDMDDVSSAASRGVVPLVNKPPRWNESVGAYVLNFNGRVTMASVKNFQLVVPDDEDRVVLQFGRIDKNTFTMDFQWPLSPLQAFGIVLSSFDYKLACE